MIKNAILVSVAALITLLGALLIVRWCAPKLLGIPVVLQMVQVSKVVVPFFDSVFRPEDYREDGPFIISDPYLHRARPLYEDMDPVALTT